MLRPRREQPTARVRKSQLSDLDRILAIEQASFGKDAWPRKLFLEYYRKCPELFLVAIIDRHIAGYIITCAGARNAELASIAVRPRDRRHGVGQAMLDQTLAELRTRHVQTWWLMVEVDNQPGIGFYDKYGFRRTKIAKGYYGAGRDAWRMRYTVTATKVNPGTGPATTR
jgi:[ribosomal protein S18]-alanine N-acetyltransferase